MNVATLEKRAVAPDRACTHGSGPRVFRTRSLALSLAVATLAAIGVVGRATGPDDHGFAAATTPDSCAVFDHNHGVWSSLLQAYVKNGFVDYAGLKKVGYLGLDTYLDSLQGVCRKHFDTWSREQKLAFWINAYNAYTIKRILDHYPVKSIWDIGLLPGAAFRKRFIPLQRIRSQLLSLNDIEHEILRKEFREPRIHFAIVCASASCPVLRAEAYRPAELEQQLDDAARAFVRDPTRNQIDRQKRVARLSAIFKWFREDFERNGASLTDFIARYADTEAAAALTSGKIRVEFLEYDWSLNGR